MITRGTFSAALIGLSLILAFLPIKSTRSLHGDPEEVLLMAIDPETVLTPDQVARYLANNDSTLQLIDLRSAEEFNRFSIPGAINIPYEEIVTRDPSTYLGTGNFKNIFYSNGDLISGYAHALATGFGFKNCFTMKGGMNEWISTVINSSFSGERITARENAIYESRSKAKKMFLDYNVMPDSLKAKFLASKRFDPKKLDGGCE